MVLNELIGPAAKQSWHIHQPCFRGHKAWLAQLPSIVGTAAKHSWHGGEVKFASHEAGFAYTPGVKLVDSQITTG